MNDHPASVAVTCSQQDEIPNSFCISPEIPINFVRYSKSLPPPPEDRTSTTIFELRVQSVLPYMHDCYTGYIYISGDVKSTKITRGPGGQLTVPRRPIRRQR